MRFGDEKKEEALETRVVDRHANCMFALTESTSIKRRKKRMDRGSTRTIPVPAQMPLAIAAPTVRDIRQFGTPALQPHQRGSIPAQGIPRAFGPFAFTQDQRQITTAAIDDPSDAGGSGSLAYRAARAQYEQRANAAAQSCEATNRSVVLDFDSNQSNVAIFASGASDNKTLANPEAYVGDMSMRLPDSMTAIRANRLLYAQIPSYELIARVNGATNDLLTKPIVANAAPPGCTEEQYALTITEQFRIDARNQVVNLLPDASVVLPQTLTAVVSLLQLRRKSVTQVCGAQKEACPHYVVQTRCNHEYMPGILFYLLLGGGQSIKKQRFVSNDSVDAEEEKEDCCEDAPHRERKQKKKGSGHSSSGSGSSDDDQGCSGSAADTTQDDDDDDESGVDSMTLGKRRMRSNDPLRPGAPTACFEVLEIIDSTRFLARIVGNVTNHPPSFHAFIKRRCMRGQQPSTVFTGGGYGPPLPSSSNITPQQFLWFDPFTATDADSEYCGFYFRAHYRIQSSAMCGHGPADPCNHLRDGASCGNCGQQGCCDNACVLKEASCGGAVAYIPPPTTPCQLADFVDCVVQQVRDFLICEYESQQQPGAPLHALVDVACVGYEPQTDTYIVKRYSDGGFVRWRTLLNTSVNGDTAALNYPFRRRAMFASESNVDAKQRYLNAVFDGFHWFVVRKGVNDCFCFEIGQADKQRFAVCLPPGCYRPQALAEAIQLAMNNAVPLEEPFRFAVDYSLHPLDALSRFVAEESLRPRCGGNAKGCPSFPPCRNEPYQVQAFAFVIENRRCEPFSLLFENAPAFAALIDFEARCYQDSTRFVSRVLAPLDCICSCPPAPGGSCGTGCGSNSNATGPLARCSIGANCAPCPRRRYEAFIDSQCNFTTISQLQPGPIECSTVPDNSDCDCDRGDCVWLLCNFNCCKKAAPTVEASQSAAEVSSTVPSLCDGCCNVTCLPFCVGDVVWFEAKPPVCAKCRELRYDACECFREEEGEEDGRRRKTPLIGAVVLCIRPNPLNPCQHYISVHIDMSSIVSPRLIPSCVGFNLHLHPVLPPLESLKPNVDSNQRLSSQKSAVARWLGFSRPFTRMDCRSYTSNGPGESLLDGRIVLVIPELVTLGLSEQRENHYQQQTPFDNILTENYNVLTLDRARLAYIFDTAAAGPPLGYGAGTTFVPPTTVYPPAGAALQPCPPMLTFQLYRADGTAYGTGGYALVASLQIMYC